MHKSRKLLLLIFVASFLPTASSHADVDDWAEGSLDDGDGATRDFYNRAAKLPWTHRLGDWVDARGREQGSKPYASTTVEDDDKPKFVEWDVTELVSDWISGKSPNQGFFLRRVDGKGNFVFGSRESPDDRQRPALVLVTANGETALAPATDTFLDGSTYRSKGRATELRVADTPLNTLLRFDLSGINDAGKIQSASLRLWCTRMYGGSSMRIGVFRCSQGHSLPASPPKTGLAWKYPADKGIGNDKDVLFFSGFDTSDWEAGWSQVGKRGAIEPTESDATRKLQTLQGKALRVRIAKGANSALNTLFRFRDKIGKEPEEIWFRYYLRLGDDWNQTLQGGKMPGISGTYGIAGWGGRPSHGNDGWSARGAFDRTLPAGNPLAGRHPIGTYCYHAAMKGKYGDIWIWQKGLRGYLRANRWYCIEQNLKLNTPGKHDGILRAWVDGRPAFEKTDIRFRDVAKLRIETIWMNVYHGGKLPSPRDQHLYIDNVVVARSYIGPARFR
ncbi:MAG: DNRLRE domain-containing protein [Planctomycetota bacterium]